MAYVSRGVGSPRWTPARYNIITVGARQERGPDGRRTREGAAPVVEQGSVVVDSVDSAALRGNPHGDPARRALPVYLPPSYAHGERRYPTIYWLPGFGSTALGGVTYDPWSPSLPDAMDRALAEGAPEAILVLVDGFTRFGGSQYLNSAANGRYEDYVV